MTPSASSPAIAFSGLHLIAAGTLASVAAAVRKAADLDGHAPVLVFDAATSETIELDLRGSVEAVVARLPADEPAVEEAAPPAPDAPRGRGRPRMGVVAREVTLLPRHWEWLASQPGGASVALRKLVEDARRVHAGRDAARRARDVAYRFMSTIGSSLAGFEEVSRALFAADRARFDALVAEWPAAVRDHLLTLAAPSFADPTSPAP